MKGKKWNGRKWEWKGTRKRNGTGRGTSCRNMKMLGKRSESEGKVRKAD